MKILELPKNISELLERLDAPERLIRHLRLVYSTANDLLSSLKQEFPLIKMNEALVLFGSVTHDIGKTEITDELYKSGTKHEIVGMNILLNHGFSTEESRFANTHGNWSAKDLTIEDLLVSLSDKVWKGKRIPELEELICKQIADNSTYNYWSIYTKLDLILEKITLEADNRIAWQGH